MKTKHYFFYILLPFMAYILSFCTSKVANDMTKGHTVHMNIEGIKFDSIRAKLLISGPVKWVTYPLKTDDHINWSFQIPDSIFTQFSLLTFQGFQPHQEIANAFVFRTIFKTDTIRWNAILTSNENNIHVNILYVDQIGDDMHGLIFQIKEEETDLEIPLSLYFYDKYFDWNDGKISYEEVVGNYQKLVMEYPDSYALAKVVKMEIDWFKVEDAEKIVNLFSDRIKATDQGLFLKNYIERKKKFTKFDNIQLPDWKTEKPEYIIQDTTKHCLVIFSASWCGPCRAEIPLLKEMYNQYKSKLDMVYISTDMKETIDDWKKLMEKEKIPWRSVLAGYENGKISIKYFISSIPTTYLVKPDGSFEQIEIRDKASQEKLKNMFTK